MNLWDFTRSPASINLLLDFGKEAGLGATEILRGSKLSERQLGDPNAEITVDQEMRVIRNLLIHLKAGPELGLRIAQRYKASTLGMWGFGVISSSTVGEAIARGVRLLPLSYTFAPVCFGVDKGLAYLKFSEVNLDAELQTFLLNREMAFVFSMMRETIGDDFQLNSVSLRRSRSKNSSNVRELVRTFGIEPIFDESSNSLMFDQNWLTSPMPLANRDASLMCDQLCNELLEKRRAKLGTATIVKQYLGLQANHIPDLNEMANLLYTSERTLKRRLSSEGTSFRNLVMEFQRDQAFEYLQDGRLSVAEIATRLGFSDASSFSQSFKRWTGEAPFHFRKSLDVSNPSATS